MFLERIGQLSDYMADQGVQLAFHHHMGTVVEKAHEVDRLMAGTPDTVGLLLDTGHLTFAGDDPAQVAQKVGAADQPRPRQGRPAGRAGRASTRSS